MSESSSEDFSDSDSDASQVETPAKAENGKRKVIQQKKSSKADDSDSSDTNNEPESAPQPVKKRKTIRDYLNEKVS